MQKFNSNKPFFFDGAFGTYYNQISAKNDSCEYANLNDKDTVYKIHREYIDAGVNAIKTNTFGANSLLSPDFNEIANIIKSGYEIASAAVKGTSAVVFADIGYINSEDISSADEYVKISEVFIDCGAKHFLFETLAEYDMLKPALKFIKSKVSDAVIILSFAVSQDGYTKKGHYYKDLIEETRKNPYIDIIGLNCICGPSHLYNLIKELDIKDVRFCAMPNSGYPSTVNGRTVFRDNTDYFSQKLLDIYNLGVKIVGGCCGTTPAHIDSAIKKLTSSPKKTPAVHATETKKDLERPHINTFKDKLLSGKKVIAVELDPPVDTEFEYLISAAEKARKAGADIITIADSPLARTRADSVIISAKIKREVEIEVLPHLSCRDRNQIGIKASLLGANIENISNILAVTGDPVIQTDRGDYKGVFSFNSFNLISYIDSLNNEVFGKSPFFIGGALNVNLLQFENELKRAKTKEEKGAKFFLTQPIFSDTAAENLNSAHKRLNSKILAGILPVAGYKNALFLNNEVSGITIPDNLIEGLKDKNQEEAYKTSIDFCLETIKKTYKMCDGYYLITPLKKIDMICDIIINIRSMEK